MAQQLSLSVQPCAVEARKTRYLGPLPATSMLTQCRVCPTDGGPLDLAQRTYARLLRKSELDLPLVCRNTIECPEATLSPTWQLPGLYINNRGKPKWGEAVSVAAASFRVPEHFTLMLPLDGLRHVSCRFRSI
jgi:hypothetical protein